VISIILTGKECCWPSGKPNEASRGPSAPAPADNSLYGLAEASSQIIPSGRDVPLSTTSNPSQTSPHVFATSPWYNNLGSTVDVGQFGANLSPITTMTPSRPFDTTQGQMISTGLTPFVNFVESPILSNEGHLSTAPQQLDSVFSGIDFSEVCFSGSTTYSRVCAEQYADFATDLGSQLLERHFCAKYRPIPIPLRSPRDGVRPRQSVKQRRCLSR
jgi:hypothetical protein